jgi:predicted TPR repeat methyltransferase
LSARPALAIVRAADGYLIYDVNARRVHHLNPAAALVFELCDGTRVLADLRTELEPLLGADAWEETRAWVRGALRHGPLQTGAAPPPDPRLASPEACAALVASLRNDDQPLAAYICQHRLAELAPDDADAWYRLGDLAQILGRRQDARAAYERYRDLLPEPDTAMDLMLVSLRDEEPPPRAPDRCVAQLFESFAQTYDEHMVEQLQYCAPELLMASIARAHSGLRDLDVLDLGCGTGLSGERLRPIARRLTGVDLSDAMIARARDRKSYDALHLTEITAFLDRRDIGPFDLIWATDVLIYFGDLQQVVRPAATHLRPGGLFAFTVEAAQRPPFQLTDSGRFAHHRTHIVHVATTAGLSVGCLDEGILRYEYGDPVPGLIAVLRREAAGLKAAATSI